MSTDNTSQLSPDLLEKLRHWLLSKLNNATDLEILDAVEPSQGFSSRTVLFMAKWKENHRVCERQWVARIQRETVCPFLADIFYQYRVMKVAFEQSVAVVPKIVFAETDSTVIGDPFFIMERIDGRVPSDFPSYHQQGWFADLSDTERELAWWNGIKEMEKLHRLNVQAFPCIAELSDETPSARFYLEAFIGNWFEWATQGQSYPELEQALQFLIEHAPPVQQSGLVWNDARLGNTMFKDDLSVAALIDFEVASLGPPELDMAHWLYLDEVFSGQFGIERISGIPDRQATIKGFERIYGWSMPYFAYYEAVAALKIVVLTIRDYSNGKTMNTPDALPGFLMERLRQYLAEYREYLAASPAKGASMPNVSH